MKRIYINLICLIFGISVCFLWINRGVKIGEKDYVEWKKKEIRKRVIGVDKPELAKSILIIFSDSTRFYPYTNGLNTLIEAGDSLYKYPNACKYVIFKGSNPLDSFVYEWIGK